MTAATPHPPIDTSKPHSARVYDALLGGKDNYPVDQAMAELLPIEAKIGARQQRSFMNRATAWLAGEGVTQFLDIGTGIPTAPNLHQTAQEIVPSARVVYCDNDPIVLRHAEALLISRPEGRTDYVHADVREPAIILDAAREQVAGFFEGLEIVAPGLVEAPEWFNGTAAPTQEFSGIYVAVARVP
ncbi:methyltransferase [Streptomyces albus subsp. albus]|nr:methyltransferase [Streptomyces albus subsp. albus]